MTTGTYLARIANGMGAEKMEVLHRKVEMFFFCCVKETAPNTISSNIVM